MKERRKRKRARSNLTVKFYGEFVLFVEALDLGSGALVILGRLFQRLFSLLNCFTVFQVLLLFISENRQVRIKHVLGSIVQGLVTRVMGLMK
jgi:hypothetical protein